MDDLTYRVLYHLTRAPKYAVSVLRRAPVWAWKTASQAAPWARAEEGASRG